MLIFYADQYDRSLTEAEGGRLKSLTWRAMFPFKVFIVSVWTIHIAFYTQYKITDVGPRTADLVRVGQNRNYHKTGR